MSIFINIDIYMFRSQAGSFCLVHHLGFEIIYQVVKHLQAFVTLSKPGVVFLKMGIKSSLFRLSCLLSSQYFHHQWRSHDGSMLFWQIIAHLFTNCYICSDIPTTSCNIFVFTHLLMSRSLIFSNYAQGPGEGTTAPSRDEESTIACNVGAT